MKLIKYRDWGTSTYTYFWASENDKVISPYFDSQEQAEEWMSDKSKQLTDNQKES